MSIKISRDKAERLFQVLRNSDDRIKQIRLSVKDPRKRSRLIKEAAESRRKGSTKSQRLFVRVGLFDKIARQRAMSTIRKTKKGFRVRIGGRVRGSFFKFRSRSMAINAVNRHHDNALNKSLGPKRASQAKKLFSNR